MIQWVMAIKFSDTEITEKREDTEKHSVLF
jgi:hypothetical protein